jgi:hypothetical protein
MKEYRRFLEKSAGKISLEQVELPKMLDNIISDREIKHSTSVTFNEFLARTEEYEEDLPRNSLIIPDYNRLHKGLKETFEELENSELEYPGLEGANMAAEAIEVLENRTQQSNSAPMIIGMKVDQQSNSNPYQTLAPQGTDSPVETPEWYSGDDWFSDLGDGEYVGIILDDHTALAKYVMDNARSEYKDIETQFWKAYQETIENYTGI